MPKATSGMEVRHLGNGHLCRITEVGVEPDVSVDAAESIERVCESEESDTPKLVVIQYLWTPHGGPQYKSRPHHYGVYPASRFNDMKSNRVY